MPPRPARNRLFPHTVHLFAAALFWTNAVHGAAPTDAGDPATRELSTGRVSIRVPNGRIRCLPPRTGRSVAGPVLGIRGPDGVWRGSGWIDGESRVVEIRGRRLGADHLVTYRFEGGGHAEIRFFVSPEADYFRVMESSEGCTNTWVLSFEENFRADRVLAKPTEMDDWTGVHSIRRSGHIRHGRIAVWSQFGRILDLNDWMGVFGGEAEQDVVGFLRLHADAWTNARANLLSVWERDGEVRLEADWRGGRREWALVLPSRGDGKAEEVRKRMRVLERDLVWRADGWVIDWTEPLPLQNRDLSESDARDKSVVLSDLGELEKVLEDPGYIAPPDVRRFIPVCETYRRLRGSGAFSAEEDRRARRALASLAYTMMRSEVFPWRRIQRRTGDPEGVRTLFRGRPGPTYNAERYSIVGRIGLLYPRHPMFATWIGHFVQQFGSQMNSWVYPGGAWEDGFSGAYETLIFLTPVAMQLREFGVTDLLEDRQFRSMWEFLVQTATPPLLGMSGSRTIPAIGKTPSHEALRDLFFLGARAFEKTDPVFAGRLLWVHRAMGGNAEWDPGRVINTLSPHGWKAGGRGVVLGRPKQIYSQPYGLKSGNLPGFGAVLRGTDSAGSETLLVFRCGSAWGRSHDDDGSIQLYARGRALIVDAGLGGEGRWRHRARGHSRVAFTDLEPANFLDGRGRGLPADHRGRVRSFVQLPDLEYLAGNVETNARAGRAYWAPYSTQLLALELDREVANTRHILSIKSRYYVVYDDIYDVESHGLWLHSSSEFTSLHQSRVSFHFPLDTALDVHFVRPDEDPPRLGDVRTTAGVTRFVQTESPGGDGYLVLLRPRAENEQPLTVREVAPAVVEVRDGPDWDVLIVDRLPRLYRDLRRGVRLEGSVVGVRRIGKEWVALLVSGKLVKLPGLTVRSTMPISLHRARDGKLTVTVIEHNSEAEVRLDGRWLWRRRLKMANQPARRMKGMSLVLRLPPGVNRFLIE